MRSGGPAQIGDVGVAAYTIPTSSPEADGTLEWTETTIVICEVEAGGESGLGYTYCDAAAATLIEGKLAGLVRGRDAFATAECWQAMVAATRNLGRPGIVSCAIAAIDVALHDLKAKLIGLPLAQLLGLRRAEVPIYGSGGFTSYDQRELEGQLAGWVEAGIGAVKMKVGRDPSADPARVRAARVAIGDAAQLFVDANGAYSRKQALAEAEAFADCGVSWFEEPVSSNDLEGLALIRDRAPAGIEISAGEYGYDTVYFRRMLQAGAVDVLQADATRCAGITGFLAADALCQGFETPLSSHTAPTLHLPACCAAQKLRHMEWFHDHVRIERMLFDGVPEPVGGCLRPGPTEPGLGIVLKREDVERYRC